MVSALGPRFGEEGSSSEAVDFKGVQSVIEAAEAFLSSGDEPNTTPASSEQALIVPGKGSGGEGEGPGGMWQSLDDVIMGGKSSSGWKAGVGGGVLERQSGKTFGRWAGTLVTDGGGFCGTVVKVGRVGREGGGGDFRFLLFYVRWCEFDPIHFLFSLFSTDCFVTV